MCKDVYGYVYMVKNLVNGKLYFGITVNDFDIRYNGNIAKNTHNDHLRNSINTYGIENFEINEEFDIAYTEDDLWDLEDMYICLYNTLDEHYGYNKRRSGSKRKGCGKMSEESKKKMSESSMGENNPMYGISPKERMDEETYKQWLENHKTSTTKMWEDGVYSKRDMKGENNPMYGKTHSEETRQKQSELKQGLYDGGKNPFSQKIVCVETKQVFDTVKEAGIWCGLKDGTSISHYLNGKRKSAGKHPITNEKLHWMYYEDYLKLQEQN